MALSRTTMFGWDGEGVKFGAGFGVVTGSGVGRATGCGVGRATGGLPMGVVRGLGFGSRFGRRRVGDGGHLLAGLQEKATLFLVRDRLLGGQAEDDDAKQDEKQD